MQNISKLLLISLSLVFIGCSDNQEKVQNSKNLEYEDFKDRFYEPIRKPNIKMPMGIHKKPNGIYW